MQPDENKNPTPTEPAPNSANSQPLTTDSTNLSQPVIGSPAPPTTPTKPNKKLVIILVFILVLILIGGGAFALYHSKHKNNAKVIVTTTNKTKTVTKIVSTNTWTGKGGNYNWNDATNWTLGIPTNDQNLEINVADVTQPTDQYGATSFAFVDNIPNLTINKLVIDGQVDSIIFDIKGDPLSITDGITDSIITTDSAAAIPQVQIDNLINFTGNQTNQTSGKNLLTFSSTGETINIGTYTIQFNSTGTSQISVSGEVNGTGEIYLPANAIGSDALLTFGYSSPNFDGKVIIGSGDSINVSNQDSQTGGYGTVDGLGNSSVTIMSGGSMVVGAAGTSSFTVNNPISVSGNGINNSNGSVSGAISACVTSAEQGCGANESITFTGQVKLLGDTQIGQSTPSSLGANNTHVDYTFNNLDKNGYTLKTVTDYYSSAEF